MSLNSWIEWTNATLNPIRARRKDNGKVGSHCEKVSPTCLHCYAAAINLRNLPAAGTGLDYVHSSRDQVEIFLDIDVLRKPLHWKKPRKIFLCSMTDLFGDFVQDDDIATVWRMMSRVPWHTYQILTKRADRMARIMPRLVSTFGVLPNVQLGVTVENNDYAHERIPWLLQCQAALHWISYEAALGAISRPALEFWLTNRLSSRIGWVVAGGESGQLARPSHPDWFRVARDVCQQAGVPFFFKQWGSWKPISEIPDAEVSKLHISNRKAPAGEAWKQADLDEAYGQRCKVRTEVIRFDGQHGSVRDVLFEAIEGYSAYTTFKLGKHKSGSLLDGREHKEFPEVRT